LLYRRVAIPRNFCLTDLCSILLVVGGWMLDFVKSTLHVHVDVLETYALVSHT